MADKQENIRSIVSLGPGGFDVMLGKVMVSESEGLPALILNLKVKGETVFTWCLTEAAVPYLRDSIAQFEKDDKP